MGDLNGFKPHSYGDKALNWWQISSNLREELCNENLDTIVSGYEMACELMLKHILKQKGLLKEEHVYAQNLWTLVYDAGVTNCECYKALLQRLERFCDMCSRECDDIDEEQALRDYFLDSQVFERADHLLEMLYTVARKI